MSAVSPLLMSAVTDERRYWWTPLLMGAVTDERRFSTDERR